MNYYEHHIGDYAQATAHLSYVEDAAYSRLMRKYYAEEAPLPADLRAVQRLVQARTEEERAAVQTILEEFFTLEADGWHQRRIDAEIARYHEKRAKKVASANLRWDRERAMRPQSGAPLPSAADFNRSDADAGPAVANAMPASHQSPHTSHQTPGHKPGAPAPGDFPAAGSEVAATAGLPGADAAGGATAAVNCQGATAGGAGLVPGRVAQPRNSQGRFAATSGAEPELAGPRPGRRATEKFDPLAARPANVGEAVWAAWCQFRAEIRKPLTRSMCAGQAKLLAGRADAEAIIGRSIANGWQGLFPEKIALAGPRADLNAMDYGGSGDGAF